MNVEVEVTSHFDPTTSIEDVAKEATPKVVILGVGGGGSNIVTWMIERVVGARTVALNSDAQHLTTSKAGSRVLLGYQLCGGLGCGGFPEQGAKAAEESAHQIEKAIGDANLVIIASALGGGTGTGASPIVAKIAREMGALVIGAVTIPFNVEGTRITKAKQGLADLVDVCDSVIVIDNNRLRKIAGELPIRDAFAVANARITDFINNITEALSVPGIMNLDFADIKAIMMGGGVCAVGFGQGSGDNKVEDAVNKALDNQLLDIEDISVARGALVHIEGGDDMTLEDVNKAGELVLESINKEARVIWGLTERKSVTVTKNKPSKEKVSSKKKA
jgi:cell division protein FtsZ